MLNNATAIVDFFNKQDEIKKAKLNIKRPLLAANNPTLHDIELRNAVMERFMELARVKFKP